MARASGGANNMRPLNWAGGTNGKDLKVFPSSTLQSKSIMYAWGGAQGKNV